MNCTLNELTLGIVITVVIIFNVSHVLLDIYRSNRRDAFYKSEYKRFIDEMIKITKEAKK